MLLILSGCDSVGEEGIEGVWVEAELDESDLGARYLDVTAATLTQYDVYSPLECNRSSDDYGLTSSDGTVYTFGDGSSARRVTLDGDRLVVTRGSEPTLYERSRNRPQENPDCYDLLGPVIQQTWSSADGTIVFEADFTYAGYYTSYDSSDDCFREVADMNVMNVSGRTFTYEDRDTGETLQFTVSSDGEHVTGPGGVTLDRGGFARLCF